MDMNIEEKVKNLIQLLRGLYLSQKNETIKARGDLLEGNGLVVSELQEVICPILEGYGILKSNFSVYTSEVIDYATPMQKTHRALILEELRTYDYRSVFYNTDTGEEIEKIEKLKKELDRCGKVVPVYNFHIDPVRLFDDATDSKVKPDKKKLTFNGQTGVLRCGEIKPHSFHRGNRGNKPLLCLFRKLWDERRYILNGVQKKAGESFPPEALANQVNVSKDKIISMLKSINRILLRFPAKIERENGILLIVTEK